VTEMITGLDLVEWQLFGSPRARSFRSPEGLRISGLRDRGARLREDPRRDFLPASVASCTWDARGVRERTRGNGCAGRRQITVYYDPMIAKLIVRDSDRSAALERNA